MILISIVSFIVIELPPGDWVTTRVEQLRASGVEVDNSEIAAPDIRNMAWANPAYERYFRWVTNMLQGDFGYSFQWNQPVNEILAERVPRTLLIAVLVALCGMDDFDADRHFVGDQAVFVDRLSRHVYQLCRAGDAGVSAGAYFGVWHPDLCRLFAAWVQFDSVCRAP